MKFWKYLNILLFLVLALLLIALFELPDQYLHIIACDVGQGDAILITYKNIQILIDGGPDNKVINCLGRHLPFWDREIELVILSHPDSDHSTGLIEVVKRYKVNKILMTDQDPGTDVYRVLRSEVGRRGVGVISPHYGIGLLVDLIHLDIVKPSASKNLQFTISNESNTNENSIVYLLTYAHFKGLFTGDISPSISDALAESLTVGPLDYIKVPHHGSANGLTENLLKATVPKIAVISVGAKNLWGFPSPKLMEMLKKYNVKILRTDEIGDIEVITDGEKVWWLDKDK